MALAQDRDDERGRTQYIPGRIPATLAHRIVAGMDVARWQGVGRAVLADALPAVAAGAVMALGSGAAAVAAGGAGDDGWGEHRLPRAPVPARADPAGDERGDVCGRGPVAGGAVLGRLRGDHGGRRHPRPGGHRSGAAAGRGAGAAGGAIWLLLPPWAIGTVVRLGREAARRAREDETRQRGYEERLRIAREVHDVVGH